MPASRRDLLKGASAWAGLWMAVPFGMDPASTRANTKLDLGVIGVANRGRANLDGVAHETIAALCDVDGRSLAEAGARFPAATRHADLRRLLDEARLDGLVVSTADHTHAVAAARALRAGLPVYCEKPLTRTVHESATLRRLAAEAGVATQMGTQIHAGDNYRRVVEAIRGGVIGTVRAVHVVCGKGWWAPRLPEGSQPVPEHMSWDLWLGPTPARDYHADFAPANWRRYWAYGGGTLADMACHYVDLPFWALELGPPFTVEAEGPAVHPHCAPEWLTLQYTFEGRPDGPLQLGWHDGGARPWLLDSLGLSHWGSGVLFVGDDGALISGYGSHELLPAERFAEVERPPQSIPASVGHHVEWLDAVREGTPTTCDFAYAAPLTEAVLLGELAYRSGTRLAWDGARMTGSGGGFEVAEALFAPPRREGWEL